MRNSFAEVEHLHETVKVFSAIYLLALITACGDAHQSTLLDRDAGTVESELASCSPQSAVCNWKGFTWNIDSGGMAGVAPGDASNVVIDANGSMHLYLRNTGKSWTASEVITQSKLGFGTYQWQVEGPIDNMPHTAVLGLFPYGPADGIGGDGQNEIDNEFSWWDDELGSSNADWGVYPPSASGKHWETDFHYSTNGSSATTARMQWGSNQITFTLWNSFVPITTTTGYFKQTTYAPANPSKQIPQQALPLMMNLWAYNALPSQSAPTVDITIRDFAFIPAGTFAVVATAGTGGTVTPAGTTNVGSGQNQAYLITAKAGYAINSVTVDGKSVGAVSNYTFSNVQAAHAISASFSPTAPQYGITASAGANGSISPNGLSSIPSGGSQTYTITPNAGYVISSVSVDGSEVGTPSTYTFTNVKGAHSIAATFSLSSSATNIATKGEGYLWRSNSSALSNGNKASSAGVNDGDNTTSVTINASGEGGAAKWEGVGVVWPSLHTVTSVTFINGSIDSYGNGYWQSNVAVQFTVDGTTWMDASGWISSPAYPYSSAAAAQRYVFSGTAISGVQGVRVVGQSGGQSWSGSFSELLIIGH